MDSRKILYENITALRERRGWSPYKLAQVSGVSERTVNYFTSTDRYPRLDTIDKLAKALNVEPWLLFIPDLDPALLESHRLTQIVTSYAHLSPDQRDFIDQIVLRETVRRVK